MANAFNHHTHQPDRRFVNPEARAAVRNLDPSRRGWVLLGLGLTAGDRPLVAEPAIFSGLEYLLQDDASGELQPPLTELSRVAIQEVLTDAQERPETLGNLATRVVLHDLYDQGMRPRDASGMEFSLPKEIHWQV